MPCLVGLRWPCWRACRDRSQALAAPGAKLTQESSQGPCVRVRRYLGQLLEGEEALAALRTGVQLLQAAVDALVRALRSS